MTDPETFYADWVTDSQTVNVYAERANPMKAARAGDRIPMSGGRDRAPILVYIPKDEPRHKTVRVTIGVEK